MSGLVGAGSDIHNHHHHTGHSTANTSSGVHCPAKSDIFGYNFFEVSDILKKKLQTIHSHLKFDHHPIRKIMQAYRGCLEDYIRTKRADIKQSLQLFDKENNHEYIKDQSQRLLTRIIKETKDFIQIMMKSIILFYQCDIKYASTSSVCLQNMVTALTIKNPIYTQIIIILKLIYKEDIEIIENNIESIINDNKEILVQLGINEVKIGEYLSLK